MARQSKRTCAPVPKVQAIPSTGEQPIPLSAMFGTDAWCPPCAPWPRAPTSSPYWLAGIQHPNMASSASQGTWWGHPSIGASANHVSSSDNLEDSDLQAWGSDSHPPGGFINFLNNAQVVSNGNSSQPIHIGDDINDSDSARTEKRLLWTKEEDLRLHHPKNRTRLVKSVNDHFGRIKKRVAWFCGSWKEANALWASGESDVDLMDRALPTMSDSDFSSNDSDELAPSKVIKETLHMTF
ncbi:hypothetical protein GUJ93_ZPchr0008g11891 [Zizania palustris]|uniref:Uncharacterized protein n=1 Tax=Zizania palustris TaxID=103762 RepID=A0A8J5REL6_ZIZPA|nr:hypothetical protein GUJ93_ZPchr0008g11891 [Zizania palustris]